MPGAWCGDGGCLYGHERGEGPTSNIVNYSGAKGYCVEVERTADRVRLRISDDGRAYNPLSHLDPDTHAPIEDRPVGGLGLVVVKRLADRVAYAREDGRNVLTLIRKAVGARHMV